MVEYVKFGLSSQPSRRASFGKPSTELVAVRITASNFCGMILTRCSWNEVGWKSASLVDVALMIHCSASESRVRFCDLPPNLKRIALLKDACPSDWISSAMPSQAIADI